MNIYVGNLSHETSEEDLRSAFEVFGQVISAKIITDRSTGESRGFGFVEMASEVNGREAIAGLNGTDLKGQALMVKEARPPRQARHDVRPSRSFAPESEGTSTVFVNNDVEKALRILKKRLSEDGDHRRLKERKHFTPRSKRKRRKALKSQRGRRK